MKLKRCPFCGGEAEAIQNVWSSPEMGGWIIRCKKCGIETPTFCRKRTAEIHWNKRFNDAKKHEKQTAREGRTEKK